ncbi:MAG: inositol monophosphatase [Syntrophales bacterium]|nr:inositol monophosphatase [Syntrophales bacterium]
MPQREELLAFALAVANRAGQLLKERFGLRHQVEFKGEVNLVTETDRMSEDLIISAIKEKWPDHDVMAEERPYRAQGAPWRWIVDPLDGTTNYAHGFPFFCVSIAWEFEQEVIGGVVYNPLLEEVFVVEKGRGVFLNGRRLMVSTVDDLSHALLATGFPYDIRETSEDNIKEFSLMAKKAQAIRRAGSAALDLAYVAAGRLDGFWELKLSPWDTAAGALMVKEAGGIVTDLEGHEHTLSTPHIVASNGRIHAQMLKWLKLAKKSQT